MKLQGNAHLCGRKLGGMSTTFAQKVLGLQELLCLLEPSEAGTLHEIPCHSWETLPSSVRNTEAACGCRQQQSTSHCKVLL